jgi:NADPH:quinone reductase-like Zn-dependent oxidoreductase
MKPSGISHPEAAAGSLAALTAWQVLKDKIVSGSKVLIHSAAGGVGHYAVQMAKHLGADVTGTSSLQNKEFVLSLGASMHIDYENQRFEEMVQDFDFVLDSIGGENTERSFKVLKPGGTIICLPSAASENITEDARKRGLKGDHFLVKSDGEDMREISDLFDKGFIKSYVSKSYSFNEIREAHLQIETGKTRGKIAIVIDY